MFILESKDKDNSGIFAEYLCTNINSAFKLLFFCDCLKRANTTPSHEVGRNLQQWKLQSNFVKAIRRVAQ